MNKHLILTLALALVLTISAGAVPGLALAVDHSAHGSADHSTHGSHSCVSMPDRAPQSNAYSTTGIIRGLDPANSRLTIAHEAIPALNWPGMTMNFIVEDPEWLEGLKTGDRVNFDFMIRGNLFIILDLEPAR